MNTSRRFARILPRRGRPSLPGLITAQVFLVLGLLLGASFAGGGTLGYFSSSQAVAGNSIGAAAVFAPSGLSAVPVSSGKIALHWSGVSWASAGYQIARATNVSGPFTQIGVTSATTLTFVDTVVNGTTYYYVVRGVSGRGGTGYPSAVASATATATNPTVVSTAPADGTTGVSRSTGISVTFSAPMAPAITASSFSLVPCNDAAPACASPGNPVSGSTGWAAPNQLTFQPMELLTRGRWYGMRIVSGSNGAANSAGNPLLPSGCPHLVGDTCYYTFRVTSSLSAPEGVIEATPNDGAGGIGTNASITLHFSDPFAVFRAGLYQAGFSLSPNCPGCAAPPYPASYFSWPGLSTQMVFTPPNGLAANTTYTYSIHQDALGVTVDYDASFTTGAGPDQIAPMVAGVWPATGASGIDPGTTITVTFSEPMNETTTISAFALKRFANASCSGFLTDVTASGSPAWDSGSRLIFTPSSDLIAGACYQISVAGSATDAAGNGLATPWTSTFKVLNGAVSTITLPGGTHYVAAGSVQATGTQWTAGTGGVVVKWPDGTALGSATPDGNGALSLTFSLPAAAPGDYTLTFSRAGGATITRPIVIYSPQLVISANPIDLSPGQSTTITAKVYNAGAPAPNVAVAFTKDDPDGRGTFGAPTNGGRTNANGEVSVVLSVSSGPAFANITVTASSGTANASVVIVDPPPLPPSDLQASDAGDLLLSWSPSPSATTEGYEVSIGSAPGRYDQTVDVGAQTTFRYAASRSRIYYVVVRAYNARGVHGPPSAERQVSLPAQTATPTGSPTPIGSATLTPIASITAAASPTPTASTMPLASRTPSVVASPTGAATPATATGVAGPVSQVAIGSDSSTPTPAREARPSISPTQSPSPEPADSIAGQGQRV